MARSANSIETPAELVSLLQELCRWPLIQTLGEYAEGSQEAATERGLGYVVLRGKGYDTRLAHLRKSIHTLGGSLSLRLAAGSDRFLFKAHSTAVREGRQNPDDWIINSYTPHDSFCWPESPIHEIDTPYAIANLRSHRTSAGVISIRRPQYPSPWNYSFEVARVQSWNAVTIAEAHQKLLEIGGALLELVTTDDLGIKGILDLYCESERALSPQTAN